MQEGKQLIGLDSITNESIRSVQLEYPIGAYWLNYPIGLRFYKDVLFYHELRDDQLKTGLGWTLQENEYHVTVKALDVFVRKDVVVC